MKKLIVFTVVLLTIVAFTTVRAEVLPDFLADLPVTGGRYWFVGSTHPNSSDDNTGDPGMHSWEYPFQTINKAIKASTARSTTSGSEYPGDVIVVYPGHTEDLDAATDLVPDVAGLTIIGLGEGEGRPRLDFTGVDGSILISGAGTVIDNIILENQIDNVVENIDVGATYVTLRNIEIRDKAGTSGLIFVMVDNANTADNLTIEDCIFTHISGTENGACSIEIDDAQDRVTIRRCRFYGDCDEAPIISDAVCTNMLLENLYVENTVAGGYAIELTAACTGFMDNVLAYTDDAATAIDPGSLKLGSDVKISMGVDLPPIPFPTSGTRINAGIIDVYVQSGSDTTIVDEALCGYPNDYFNYGWTVKFADSDGTGINVDVTDFVAATGTLTVDTTGETPAAGDRVILSFNPLMSDVVSATDLTNEVPDGSVLSYILDDAGDTSNYDDAKHSLYAIGTDTDSLITSVGALTLASGLPYIMATQDSATDTTSIIDVTYAGYGNDFFNTGWVATCLLNADSVGNAPEGQTRDITDYDSTTGDFTTAAFGAAIGTGDKFFIYYDPLKATAASTDLTNYFPDNSAMAWILDDGGDTSGFVGTTHSLVAIGDDTDAILADTVTISGGALPAAPTASSLATFIASGGTALGTALASSKSLVDAIGTNGTTVADTATGVAGMIGVNDADNVMDTSTVVANQDGSVFERLEQLMRMQPQVAETTSVALTGGTVANVFTVTGGYIEVLGLFAFVTTAVDTAACNAQFLYDPAQGADTPLCAVLDITDVTQYSYLYCTGDISDALINAVPAADVPHLFSTLGEPMVLGPCTIDLSLSTSNPSTGAATIYLYYRIIEPGAAVTAYSS